MTQPITYFVSQRLRVRLLPFLLSSAILACDDGARGERVLQDGGEDTATVALDASIEPPDASGPMRVAKTLVFSRENLAGGTDLVTIRTDGTGERMLVRSADENTAVFRSGDVIVFRRVVALQRDVYAVRLDGTGFVALAASLADECEIGVLDGRLIYTRENGAGWDLASVRLDGTDRITLATNVETYSRGAVSGGLFADRVVYTDLDAGAGDLFSVRADGTERVTLASSAYRESASAFYEPTLRRIVYARATATEAVQWRAVGLGGEGDVALTTGTTVDLAVLLAGDRLVVSRRTSTTPPSSDLYTVRLVGSPLVPLAPDAARSEQAICVVQGRVVFTSTPNGGTQRDLYSITLDGTDRQLIPTPRAGNPVRAIGDRVLFTESTDSTRVTILSIALEGSGLATLASPGADARLVFASLERDTLFYVRAASGGSWDLLSVNSLGDRTVTLGAHPTADDLTPVPFEDVVVFTRRESNLKRLVVVGADGTDERELTAPSREVGVNLLF